MNLAEKTTVLETCALTKAYGKDRGINDVTFEVVKGEIFGFIGPNGAGKSTTIRTILGLIFPDSGTVRLFGEDALTGGAGLRKRVGFVPSEVNYYENLSVKSLLKYSCDIYGVDAGGILQDYCERLRLDPARKIIDLSLGNRKKVGLIQALLHRPDLLILDEPTSGLDPLIQSRYYEILNEERNRGCTVFFSSHTLSEVERLCDRVAIIRDGRIVDISEMDRLRGMYLKRFRVMAADVSVLKVPGAMDFAEDVRIGRTGAEGYFKGDVRVLMRKLSELSIDDVTIDDPSLEEIFMHYYDEEGGK